MSDVEDFTTSPPIPSEMSTAAPTNVPDAFPKFADGDVLILSGLEKVWKLHSVTLRNACNEFAQLFDKQEPKRSKKHGPLKYKLLMVKSRWDSSSTTFRSFEVQDLNARPSTQFSFQNFNGLGIGDKPDFINTYDNLFRMFYNMEPTLSPSDTATLAEVRIYELACLAQAAFQVGAIQFIRASLESYFLSIGQVLWRQVASNPEPWADLANTIESAPIFREAMCHIVGATDLRGAVDLNTLQTLPGKDMLLRMINKKRHDLLEKKLVVERRLIDFFPESMLHPQSGSVVAARPLYSNDIYLWQALTLVRQWIASCFCSNRHHRAKDGGIEFYRKIGQGGNAYIDKDALKEFHKSFSMSAKAQKVFLLAIEHIKNEMKVVVQDVLVDLTQVNWQEFEGKLPYLSCVAVKDEELPWFDKKGKENEWPGLGLGTQSKIDTHAASTTGSRADVAMAHDGDDDIFVDQGSDLHATPGTSHKRTPSSGGSGLNQLSGANPSTPKSDEMHQRTYGKYGFGTHTTSSNVNHGTPKFGSGGEDYDIGMSTTPGSVKLQRTPIFGGARLDQGFGASTTPDSIGYSHQRTPGSGGARFDQGFGANTTPGSMGYSHQRPPTSGGQSANQYFYTDTWPASFGLSHQRTPSFGASRRDQTFGTPGRDERTYQGTPNSSKCQRFTGTGMNQPLPRTPTTTHYRGDAVDTPSAASKGKGKEVKIPGLYRAEAMGGMDETL